MILDVATGTADLAIFAVSLNPEKIIGIDISEEMLNVAKKKILKKNKAYGFVDKYALVNSMSTYQR